MIRQELIHPVISHFPIVLLTLLPCAYLCHLKSDKKESLYLYRACLYIGSLFFFMSLFTGDESLEIIKPNFCHLLDVYRHDDSAHDALIALIIVLFCDASFYIEKLQRFKKIVKVLMLLVSFTLSALIARTAHQGAMLVYEKGAAVKSVTCTP